jgi:predicted  nucleic acid-binding Zn-ribbon protein
MKITPQLAEQLAELSRLHQASRQDPQDLEVEIHYQQLRARIPRELVAVFDSRRRSGRRAFAPLVNGLCGSCFVAQPIARQFGLRHGQLVTCPGCGVVLFDPLMAEERTRPGAAMHPQSS